MSGQGRPGSLAEALILLQARLPRITKDATGQVGPREYPYASLPAIHDAVFPLLADCGLYWLTCPTLNDGRFVLLYQLVHAATLDDVRGQYPLPEAGGPQALGSAITYARRYCLISVLGIAPADDDDGAAAQAEHDRGDWHPPADPRSRKATRSRGTAAETMPWTEQPAGDDTPGTITDEQLTAIQDYWISLGIDAEDRRPLIMSALDLTRIAKTRDLSRVQGDELIAYLRGLENSTEGGA